MRPHINVTDLSQLPNLDHAPVIALDFETDSGKPHKAEAAPWNGARIAMIGISDTKTVWTISTDRMIRGPNRLPAAPVFAWLKYTLGYGRKRIIAHWIRAEVALAQAEDCGFTLSGRDGWGRD